MKTDYIPLTREAVAKRIAADITPGAYVNLGIGLPTLVANYIDPVKEIILHSENGILGMGPTPNEGEEDEDLINASSEFVTLMQGGSYSHHGDSFMMMRGGHIDITVLGAFQVAENGDLANWHTGAIDAVPAVGGAMDLAVGAKEVWIAMSHLTQEGQSKIVKQCSYPLTGLQCVDRIYSDLAIMEVREAGLLVTEMIDGISFDELQSLTEAVLIDGR